MHEDKRIDKMAVKSMASLAKNIAKDSINVASWVLVHQPKEPKDLVKRLQEMKK